MCVVLKLWSVKCEYACRLSQEKRGTSVCRFDERCWRVKPQIPNWSWREMNREDFQFFIFISVAWVKRGAKMACLHDHSCEDHDCSSDWSLYRHIDLSKVFFFFLFWFFSSNWNKLRLQWCFILQFQTHSLCSSSVQVTWWILFFRFICNCAASCLNFNVPLLNAYEMQIS